MLCNKMLMNNMKILLYSHTSICLYGKNVMIFISLIVIAAHLQNLKTISVLKDHLIWTRKLRFTGVKCLIFDHQLSS